MNNATSPRGTEAVQHAEEAYVDIHLSDGDLKVKINTFIWENGPASWTLGKADDVACKMFYAFRHAEEAGS